MQDAGTRHGLRELEALKGAMDTKLLSRDYSGWDRAVLTFRGDLCLASVGAVSPNRDLDDVKLQNLKKIGVWGDFVWPVS